VPAFLLYSVGVLGAGDAKGIAVLGALYGPLAVPGLYMWMILSGGVLSITLLVAKGELRSFLGRWAEMVKALLFSGRFVHTRPEAGSAAAGGIPFAVCMALGSIAQPLWSWA
jgi:prepilin peptidase CpaA